MDKEKQIRIFDKQAARYDRARDDSQQKKLRGPLIRQARGNVLELAVGAGANFSYYPSTVRITAVDFSPAMLEKARQAADNLQLDARFICMDMEEIDFPDQSFDTIVSTLSLCSYEHPQRVLKQINRWCKPDGQILLVEHGISSNFAVSSLLRFLNPLLYRANGCHCTRDIMQLVSQSGMEIVHSESRWLDMIHLIQAKPANQRT